jgi:hypothetical protein
VRHSTSGNSRPHIVSSGYQDRCRVPGPIQPEGERSLRLQWIAGPILGTAAWLLLALEWVK